MSAMQRVAFWLNASAWELSTRLWQVLRAELDIIHKHMQFGARWIQVDSRSDLGAFARGYQDWRGKLDKLGTTKASFKACRAGGPKFSIVDVCFAWTASVSTCTVAHEPCAVLAIRLVH